MENGKPNNINNLLEVDLGFYGKINSADKKRAAEFFKSLETKEINKDIVEAIRERYNDALENDIYPKIEKKIKECLQKISDARCSGDLKKLMNEIANEGLIIAERQDNGNKIYYRKCSQIERTQAIIIAYAKKKNELSKKYNEILSKPNSIRIDGRKSPAKGDRRAGSYSLVLTVDFGENKHGHETVRITDFLPVHGPTPDYQSRTYIVGYSVPKWLEYKIPEIKQKIKDAKEKCKDATPCVSETKTEINTAVINIETALLKETKNKDEKELDEVKIAA